MWGTRVPLWGYTCKGRHQAPDLRISITGMRSHLSSVAPRTARSTARRTTALVAGTGSLNIRFKTSAGKNYYLKVQVSAR